MKKFLVKLLRKFLDILPRKLSSDILKNIFIKIPEIVICGGILCICFSRGSKQNSGRTLEILGEKHVDFLSLNFT